MRLRSVTSRQRGLIRRRVLLVRTLRVATGRLEVGIALHGTSAEGRESQAGQVNV